MKCIFRGLTMLLLTSLFSCKEHQKDLSIQVIGIAETSKLVPLSSAFFRFALPESVKIGDIDQIEEDGRYIYLLQSETLHRGLFVFDVNGRYIAKIGNFGRGVGEYQQPSSFTLTDDCILILDTSNNYVLRYKRDDFTFVNKVKIFNTSYFDMVDDDRFLCVNNNYESDKPYYDKQYILTDSQFSPQNGEIDKVICSPYATGPSHPIYRFGKEVRTYMQNSPYIYCFTANGNYPIYKIDFDTYALPSTDFIQKISANRRNYYRDLTDSGYISYYDFYEVSDQMQINFFVNHAKKIGFYSKTRAQGFFAPKEIWQQAYPFSDWITIGTLDDSFVSILVASDLQERREEIEIPADLKNILSNCSDTDLILWKFKLAE